MGGCRTGAGNTWRGVSALGGKLTKTTDKRQMTEHQGVGGENSGEKSLRGGPNRWERSDPIPKEIRTRRTESSQRFLKEGDGGGVEFTSRHSTSGWEDHGDWIRLYAPYGREILGLGSCRTRNSPEAFTHNGDRVTRYGLRMQRVDTKGGSPFFGGAWRDWGLRECGILDQMW